MGSDLGVRVPASGPVPPAEPSSALRARRSLAAARAARDGITTMVDALRLSRPPRAPLKSNHVSTVPAARRHALIPHAEGRAQLEARIRALEDALAARDDNLLKLKRQWGRALVRAKHLERDRDVARDRAAALQNVAQSAHAAATANRARLERVVADIQVPLPALSSVANKVAPTLPALADEVRIAVEDIQETIAEARDDLAAHPPPPLPVLPAERGAAREVASKVVRPRRGRGTSAGGSVGASDDDAKSVASYASSTAFGDDRETQLQALVELVDILDAKLANGSTHAAASASLARAKRTINGSRVRGSAEVRDIVAERDKLRRQLEAVMQEKDSVGGEDAALAMAARAEAELRDVNKEKEVMRERLQSLEKIAEKGVRSEALTERNNLLEGELRSAKKTVGRLVQERNSLRKTAPSSMLSNASNASKTPARCNSEAMRRILDWRQRASSENHSRDAEPITPVPFSGVDDEDNVDRIRPTVPGINRAEPLPDRVTGQAFGATSPMKKRRTGILDTASATANDATSLSDRSLDVGVSDSISAQSLPVQGFLRRHDSFLSAGNVSASGDEITLTNTRNIFSSRTPNVEDGLRALLGGP